MKTRMIFRKVKNAILISILQMDIIIKTDQLFYSRGRTPKKQLSIRNLFKDNEKKTQQEDDSVVFQSKLWNI